MFAADSITTSFIAVVSLMLVAACTVTDILSRRIPNEFLAIALGIAVICHGLDSGLSGLVNSFFGLMVGLAVLLPLYVQGGTGAGDVKLLATVGALLTWKGAIIAGAATLVSGGILGLTWILWRIFDAYFATQFARLSQLHSAGLSHANITPSPLKLRGTSFPYAPAIACGTCVAVWYFGLLGAAA